MIKDSSYRISKDEQMIVYLFLWILLSVVIYQFLTNVTPYNPQPYDFGGPLLTYLWISPLASFLFTTIICKVLANIKRDYALYTLIVILILSFAYLWIVNSLSFASFQPLYRLIIGH